MSEPPRIPVSTRCREDIWEAARAAAQGMQRHDPTFSLARLVEAAVAAEAARLAEEFNGGEPWPLSNGLRRGRRLTT